MNITSAVFDGTRIAMEIETPGNLLFHITDLGIDRVTPPTFAKGSIEHIEVHYQNRLLSHSYSVMDSVKATSLLLEVNNEILGEATENGSVEEVQFPDKLDLTVDVKLKDYAAPFTFHVPLSKSTDNTVLASGEIKTFRNINMKIDRLELTPITTQLNINFHTNKEESLQDMLASIPAAYKTEDGKYLILQYEISDEQGHILKQIGFHALQAETQTLTFEPFKDKPKSVTIRPYLEIPTGEPAGPNIIDENGKETKQIAPSVKQYIPELEITLAVQ
jgi:hypothetical protein